ncbi:MAG: NAD(P)/FAD-dependent oxidoreductase [Candidatus Omnitrophota bacterium]
MNIIIIGNSAAGTAAIEAIRMHDRQSTILQLSDEEPFLYSRCLLSYYIADTISNPSLLYRQNDFHHKMDVTLHAGKGFHVSDIHPNEQTVTCANGDTFSYDRLLIATGSSAKIPSLIPKDVEGIHVLRNLADAEQIRKKIQNVNHAVVLGGGLIGMKAADALSKRGLKTTVMVGSDRVLSQMIDPAAARIIFKQAQDKDIDILLYTDISEILSQDGKLTGIKTNRGKVIDCELLIIAKGVAPNTDIIESSGIIKNRGIKTNAFMQTNDPNIFAAGDVAEAWDMVLDDVAVNALWTCAVQQGRIAGLNMIGKQIPYNGAVGMNALNICDISLISFGITTPDDESAYRVHVYNQADRNIYKKIIVGSDNRIKGIILLGKITNAGVLLSLIQRKTDVSPFEDELLNDRFNYGKLLKYGGEEFKKLYDARGAFFEKTAPLAPPKKLLLTDEEK